MKSLYVHIPFCMQKCLYCDFNSYSGKENLIEEYIIALKKEIQSYNLNEFKTVYFGGGTPSIIPAKYIAEIMEMIKCDGEVTLELNPGTINSEKLQIYKEAGINRLSMGLQTTQDSILKEIGRIHTLEEFDKAYKMAREAGFDNINVDLMFGLPNQMLRDVEESVEYLIKLEPEHISCYSLILHNDIFKNLPSDEEEREMYYLIINKLKEAGYEHYEISNFAKLNKKLGTEKDLRKYISLSNEENIELNRRSKHNLCYWNQDEYIGVGAGASSYLDGKRYTNELSIEKYIVKVNSKEQYYEIEEVQDEESRIREYMILRLRLLEGVDVKEAYEKFGENIYEKFEREIQKLLKEELVEADTEKIKLTKRGLDFANRVWAEFL